MKISNNFNSPSFRSLFINYGAEENLRQLPKPVLCKLYRLGEHLEETEYMDVFIKRDLIPVIREKGVPFGEIRPPFIFEKPEAGSNIMRVITKSHGGEAIMGRLNDDKRLEMLLTFKSPETAVSTYYRLMAAKGNIEKAVMLAKAIETQKVHKKNVETGFQFDNLGKEQVVDELIEKFGTFKK